MKIIVVGVTALVVGLLLLWREARPSHEVQGFPVVRGPTDPQVSVPSRPLGVAGREAPARGTEAPLGGVRPWSPTAVPTDGPDPFAPVPQIRTAEDTRAGLAD